MSSDLATELSALRALIITAKDDITHTREAYSHDALATVPLLVVLCLSANSPYEGLLLSTPLQLPYGTSSLSSSFFCAYPSRFDLADRSPHSGRAFLLYLNLALQTGHLAPFFKAIVVLTGDVPLPSYSSSRSSVSTSVDPPHPPVRPPPVSLGPLYPCCPTAALCHPASLVYSLLPCAAYQVV